MFRAGLRKFGQKSFAPPQRQCDDVFRTRLSQRKFPEMFFILRHINPEIFT